MIEHLVDISPILRPQCVVLVDHFVECHLVPDHSWSTVCRLWPASNHSRGNSPLGTLQPKAKKTKGLGSRQKVAEKMALWRWCFFFFFFFLHHVNVCLLIVYDILYISWYGMYCYKSESLWKINILACQSFTVCPYSLHTTDNSDTHCSDPWDVEHKLNYAMWEMVTRTLKSIHVCPTWQGSLKHLLKSKQKQQCINVQQFNNQNNYCITDIFDGYYI